MYSDPSNTTDTLATEWNYIPTEAEMLANPEDYGSFDEFQDVINGRIFLDNDLPDEAVDWDDEDLQSLLFHTDTYYDDPTKVLVEQEDGSLAEEDPFKELDELVHAEKMEAEHMLLSAIENYISLGGTYEDIMKVVGEVI